MITILNLLMKVYLWPFLLVKRLRFIASNLLDEGLHIYGTIHLIRKNTNLSAKKYTVLDIGAFDGRVARIFSREFPEAEIVAFEPNPNVFNTYEKGLNAISNVKYVNSALDREVGVKELNITDNLVSSSLNKIKSNEQYAQTAAVKIKTDTLDSLFASTDVLLIKLDTQGYEMNVLMGGEKTLKRTKYVLVEMNNHEQYEGICKYYEVDEYLRKNNFVLLNIFSSYNSSGIKEYDGLYGSTMSV